VRLFWIGEAVPWAVHVTMLLALLLLKYKLQVIFLEFDVYHFHIQTILTPLHQVPVQKKHEMIEYITFLSTFKQMLRNQLVSMLRVSSQLCPS